MFCVIVPQREETDSLKSTRQELRPQVFGSTTKDYRHLSCFSLTLLLSLMWMMKDGSSFCCKLQVSDNSKNGRDISWCKNFKMEKK